MKARMKKLAVLMLAGALVLSGFTYPTVVNAEEASEVQTEQQMDDTAQKKDEGVVEKTTDDVEAKDTTEKTDEADVTEKPVMAKKPVQTPTAQVASVQEDEPTVTADGYTEWTSTTSLPTSGTYKLMNDVTLEYDFGDYPTVTKSLTLDLNGHTITSKSGYAYFVNGSGKLTIEDSVGSGKIKNIAEETMDALIQINSSGSFILKSGTLENNSPNGYALYFNSTSSGEIVGGNIINNANMGTAIYTNTESKLSLVNGNVDNLAGNGKAVYINSNSDFTMSGGSVKTKNTASSTGAIHGNGKKDGSFITITGGTIESKTVGIYTDSSNVTVTGGSIVTESHAFQTRYTTIAPAEGSEVTVKSDSSLFFTFSGSDNKVEGGTFEVAQIEKAYSTDKDSPTVTTIEGGIFNVDPSEYVTGEDKGVISDGKDTFAAGTDEELSKAAAQMIADGATEIEVLKGNVALEIEKNGITVTNKGDGDVTVNGQEVGDAPLEIHVPVEVTTGEEFVQAVKDENVEEIIVMNSIEVTEVLTDISRDLKIEGRDGAVVKFTNAKMVFSYKDGVNVELKNLTFEGKDIAGLVQWNSAKEYKEISNPTEMPTLLVENCTFTNSAKEGAGIGLWNDNRNSVQPSASKVTVHQCEFDTIGVGLYFSEEGPLPNLQAEISSCIFRDYNWGFLGGPSNAYIHDNLFDDTGEYAVQFLLNASAPKTGTRIENNRIDSKNGIQIMPYHLNEKNALKNGEGETVTVTGDMLPTIKNNTREKDEYLVTFVAYRDGTSEYAELESGALDISENYTAGKQPQIRLVTQKVAEGKDVIDKVTEENGLMPEINNETYYENSDDVGNRDKLVNATDIKAAEKVDELIDAIGPVDKVTLDSRDAILAAKEAYEALTDKQKKLVTGYDDLLKAIEAYNTLLNAKPEPKPEPDKDKPINKPDNETTKKPGAVKTGDTANVAGYMTVMMLAAGAVVVALISKKRKG